MPPRVSDELLAPLPSGIELCYQTFGDPSGRPLLLVMGLGGPMNWWDSDLCRMLAEAGFYVIRYDNRDTGRSSRIGVRVKRSTIVRAFTGGRVRAPYSIPDLADDAFGLLDHLGLEAAHVVGVSMGGMIAQTMAITQQRRVLSLTSIMSTTGKRSVGWQHPSLLPTLIGSRGPGLENYVRSSRRVWRLIGSPGYPQSDAELRAKAEETFARGVSASGVMRQMLAVLTQPNRSLRLRALRVPTLVIHGLDDKMVHVSGGRATAAAIPGAELLLIPGMGHDMPPALFESYVQAISRTADRARVTR
ncbi:pimeloyl-ACP methyl ester carboxylesterase [Nocardioides ginsengisegetis]|uniref:Pimeloyl-ACP methyl ester carboxylesterase n=1 Tax=Nocardioides ginsengisegetis TaxID=661491 RepID=A0A7W3PAA7_9ACTN|nr:alpha/beta fold hydrolase [Nocardioides ginsengisegetis]MBA8804540.1 pimeloyl-ACP methyl ester carboxylesterase [Nocardioides ginsengisegetis]